MSRLLSILLVFLSLLTFTSYAHAGVSMILDAQTQDFLEELSYPIIEAADLDPNHVKIYIVNDSSVNAFVTKGQNIFINTGLIRKFKTPDSLIGVIAHEVGHISSGHIPRANEEFKSLQSTTIIGYMLGVVALAAGAPTLGQGILIGSGDLSLKLALRYNRAQEEAADRKALYYLKKIKYPSLGLIELLESFEMQARGINNTVNEYRLSHPISSKRIDYLKNNSKYSVSRKVINGRLQPKMDYILAKLEGFVDDPELVIKKYRNSSSAVARYALTIAYFRDSKIKKALRVIDSLIKNDLRNGYFYELKGQILFEYGYAAKSIVEFNKAESILQGKQKIYSLIFLSQALIDVAKNDSELINHAIAKLILAQAYDQNNSNIYRLLNIAYGKVGNKFLASYNYANYKYQIGQVDQAYKYAKSAQKYSEKQKTSESDKLKLEDLIQIIKNDIRLNKTSQK